MTILHSVYFWLADPTDEAARDAIIAGLAELEAIDVVQSLVIGTPAQTEARDVVENSFAVFEQMEFASLADQKAYQDHPLHAAFVDRCGHLWNRVVVYDSRVH